jgi:hypothetical protein
MIRASLPRRWSPQFVLLGAVSLAYLNAFWGQFQFDDYNVIVDNRLVHSWAAWAGDLSQGIRPLLKASYTLNWNSGLGLFGFHLVNLLIHAANVLLVYVLSRRFLSRGDVLRSDLASRAALLTALLFAVHPVQTEAVIYISGRSASLMTLCYLGSLLAYVRGVETGRGLWLYGLSPLLFLCGLATKEVAITLPAALLLWELVGPAERLPWRTIFRRQAVHWALLGVGLAVLLLHPRYEWLLTFSLGVRSLGDNLLTQVHGVTYLLSRLVWVHRLNIDPDLPILAQWTIGLAMEAGGLALLLALGLANLRRRPWLTFGILWLFLHLLPTNSILPRLDVANERQLYLPGWGVFLLAGVLLVKLRECAIPSPPPVPGSGLFGLEWSTAGKVLTVGLVVLLGTMTVARNEVYRSEIALWEDTAAKSPHKARVYNNLGYAYYLASRHAEARGAYETALRLDPRFELAGNNLLSLDAKAMALVRPALANP